MNHIDTEASLASISALGLDITSLRDITVMVPAFANTVTASKPAVCASIRFARSFRTSEVRSHLQGVWTEVQVDRETMFVNADSTCIHISSSKSLMIGSQEAVSWFVARKNADESFLSSIYNDSAGQAHIICGLDMRDVPAGVITPLLPNTQLSFKPSYLALDVTLNEQLLLDVYVFCDSNQQALEATDLMKSFVQLGIDTLMQLEQQHSQTQAANQSLENVIQQLATIGVIREGIETLENSVAQDDDTIASVRIELDKGFTYAAAFAGLVAVGANSETPSVPSTPKSVAEAEAGVAAEREEEPKSSLIDTIRSGARPRRPSAQ